CGARPSFGPLNKSGGRNHEPRPGRNSGAARWMLRSTGSTWRGPSGVLGGGLAVDPLALQLLVVARGEGRAPEAGVPAHDLLGLAPLLAPLLPLLGPRLVGLGDLAGLLVEEEGLALAV